MIQQGQISVRDVRQRKNKLASEEEYFRDYCGRRHFKIIQCSNQVLL